MQKGLKILWYAKITIITITIVGALIGYFYAYNFCKNENTFSISFHYKDGVSIDPSEIISEETIAKVQSNTVSVLTGNPTGTYAKVDIDTDDLSIKCEDGQYIITANEKCFLNSEIKNSQTTASGFLKHLSLLALNDEGVDGTYATYEKIHLKIDKSREKSLVVIPIISGSVGLAVGIGLALFLGFKNKIVRKNDIYDNDVLFRTPFHINYFKKIKEDNKTVRSLTCIAILISMMLVCKFIPIPSGFADLGISLGYLFFGVIGMCFGPGTGIIAGFISDVLGFVIKPSGAFFFGYTFNAMLAGLCYGVMFYRTKITFTKVLISRCFVNFFINVFLGSIWWGIRANWNYNQIVDYMKVVSLPKNTVYLLPQSILLFIVLKALMKPCEMANLISEEAAENFSVF